jgi:hypothetical protein
MPSLGKENSGHECGEERVSRRGPRQKDAQLDQLLTAFTVAIEKPTSQRPGIVNGAMIGSLIQEDTGQVRTMDTVEDVSLQFPLAARGQFRRSINRRSQFFDSRLALGVLKAGFDDQPLAAFGTAAGGQDLQRQQTLIAGVWVMLAPFVQTVALG